MTDNSVIIIFFIVDNFFKGTVFLERLRNLYICPTQLCKTRHHSYMLGIYSPINFFHTLYRTPRGRQLRAKVEDGLCGVHALDDA